MIEVRVGQHDGVDRVGAHRQRSQLRWRSSFSPWNRPQSTSTRAADLEQMLGARDRAGGPEKRELRHECAIMTGV